MGTTQMKSMVDYLEHYSEAITALATVVIAVYTVVLAWTSSRQSKLIASQVRLAREEFIATHRPQLRLSRFYLSNPIMSQGERPSIIFMIQNVGLSVARVTEIRSVSIVLGIEDQFPKNMGIPFSEKFTTRLESGQSEIFPVNGTVPLEDEDRGWVPQGKKNLYCLGVVVYLDELGNRRETGFCRRYIAATRQLESWPTEFEYEF
jgi:hypothetical protein